MKKMHLLIIFLLGISLNAAAQKLSEEQRQRVLTQVQQDVKELNLSEVQKEPYKEASLKFARQMKEVKNGEYSKSQKYQQFKKARKERNKAMKEILNKEQYEKHLEIQERRKQQIKANRKN